jgi:hypothetical protein
VALFYPDASAVQSATSVEVHAGDSLDGINFLLRPRSTFHIRGLIKTDEDPDALSNYTVAAALPGSSGDLLDFEGDIEENGSFDIGGLVPGAYDVQVRTSHGSVLAMTPAEVRTNDINTVVIRLPRRVNVQGTLRWPPNVSAPPTGSQVTLVPAGQGLESRIPGFINASGSFQINAVAPGRYRVYVPISQPGVYVKSLSYGHMEIPATSSFDIAEGGPQSLEVNLATDAGRVSGAVETPDPSANGYRIILVSQSNAAEPDLILGATDRTGHFTIATVPPGKYHAFAVTDFNTEVWWNPDFLRQVDSAAVEVEVPENGEAQVQLVPTPPESIQSALDRMPQ